VVVAAIFQNPDYSGDTWRLDFAKELFSIEVAFNHSTVIAWNLIKPVLAGELNHVQKSIQTSGGIVIAATQELKTARGFDSAIGTYEKFIQHLDPLRNLLIVPIMIIGLQAPETFSIEHFQLAPRKKIGRVVRSMAVYGKQWRSRLARRLGKYGYRSQSRGLEFLCPAVRINLHRYFIFITNKRTSPTKDYGYLGERNGTKFPPSATLHLFGWIGRETDWSNSLRTD
jgi:hypothetical protein